MMIHVPGLPGLDENGNTSLIPTGLPGVALAGLSGSIYGISNEQSRPDIIAAVQDAARSKGIAMTCVERLDANPFANNPEKGYFDRQCTVPGGTDMVSADMIYGNPSGLLYGLEIAASNLLSGGTPPASVPGFNNQAPLGTQYAAPPPVIQTQPAPYKPPSGTAAPTGSSNPAPQTAPAPTTQPGVVDKTAAPATDTADTTATDSSLIPGVSNTILILVGGIAAVMLLKMKK